MLLNFYLQQGLKEGLLQQPADVSGGWLAKMIVFFNYSLYCSIYYTNCFILFCC